MSLLQDTLQKLALVAVEGQTGINLDKLAEELLKAAGVEPAFKGYAPGGSGEGFPNVLCVSINNEIIHGVPDDRKFQYGDVVKLDCGLIDEEGNYDDGALTVIIGGPRAGSSVARRLVAATKEALEAGIATAKVGNTTNDIANAISAIARREGFAILSGFSGHGIGKVLHQEPDVPNVPSGKPTPLTAGMRLAIEPMFTSTVANSIVDSKNKWTVKLAKGGYTAHFEQTVTVE